MVVHRHAMATARCFLLLRALTLVSCVITRVPALRTCLPVWCAGIGQQSQQTAGVFIRKCLGCADPLAALQFAARIGVKLDYREKGKRGVFNCDEAGDYAALEKQNALFWVRGRCTHAATAEAVVQFLVRKGVKQDAVDARGRRWDEH